MSNLTELGLHLKVKGYSMDEIARKLKVTASQISKVNAGKQRSTKVEKELIRLGCGRLLKKIQLETGIFDQKRFSRLKREVKKENGR